MKAEKQWLREKNYIAIKITDFEKLARCVHCKKKLYYDLKSDNLFEDF